MKTVSQKFHLVHGQNDYQIRVLAVVSEVSLYQVSLRFLCACRDAIFIRLVIVFFLTCYHPILDLNLKEKTVPMPNASAFFCLGTQNPFRKICHKIVNLNVFNNIILACIVFSSITLAIEDPINEASQKNQILKIFDYFFTSIFTMEIVLKVISYGALFHKGSYMRNWFNLLDVLVVCVSLLSIFSGLLSY